MAAWALIHIFRRLDDANETARRYIDADRRLARREEQIYWWCACFYKKHARPATRQEIETNLAQLDVPEITWNKVIKAWRKLLQSKQVEWQPGEMQHRGCLDVPDFETPDDLERGHILYWKIRRAAQP